MDALRGITLILRTPRLWPLCAAPVLLASALYFLLGWLGWHYYAPEEDWGKLLVFLGYLVLFPFAFYLLGSGFLGLVFDPLSRAVEKQFGEGEAQVAVRPITLIGDTLKRLLLNGCLGLLAFGLGVSGLGPIPGVLAAALIGLLDYTSPAYLRRGLLLGPQAKHLLPKPDIHTLSFALIAGFLSLLPFIGLLLAPGLVVGGTLLARRRLS